MTSRASSTEAPLVGTSQTLPPSKSMPRFKPRVTRLVMEITQMTAATISPQRNVLMKLKSLRFW